MWGAHEYLGAPLHQGYIIYGHDLSKKYVAIIFGIGLPNLKEIGRELSEITLLMCFGHASRGPRNPLNIRVKIFPWLVLSDKCNNAVEF